MLRIFMSMMIILVACSPNKTVYQLPEGYESMTQQLSTANQSGPYPFVSFDLEADYKGVDGALEIEYSHKADRVEALYKHQFNKAYYAGDFALNALHPYLSLLDFSEHTDEEEVIEQVKEVFQLPQDARIYLKVQFPSQASFYYTDI